MTARRLKVAIFNDTRPCRHFGCTLVMRNLIYLLATAGIRPVWFWPVAKDWREFPKQLPKPGEIDGVIVNGEGTMHHSEARGRPHALADVAEMANDYFRVPAFLINATLYHNSSRFYGKLQSFSRIYVRDSMSQEEIQSFGLRAKVVPDLSLARNFKATKRGRNQIGATGSVVGKAASQIQVFCRERGWHYQKMQTAPPPSVWELRQPRNFAEKGIAYLQDQWGINTPEGFIDFLRGKQLIVTGRYHAVTMCLLTHTPFVAVESNTPKISGLLTDVFASTRRVFQDVNEIPAAHMQSWASWTAEEESALAVFRQRAVTSSEKMIEEIRKHLVESQGQNHR